MQTDQQFEARVVKVCRRLAAAQSYVRHEQNEELPRPPRLKEQVNVLQTQTDRNRPIPFQAQRQQVDSPFGLHPKNALGDLKRPSTPIIKATMMQYILSDNTKFHILGNAAKHTRLHQSRIVSLGTTSLPSLPCFLPLGFE